MCAIIVPNKAREESRCRPVPFYRRCVLMERQDDSDLRPALLWIPMVYNCLALALIGGSMKITPGKLAGLRRVSNDRGVIAAAAMDQRGSLQKSLAKEKGGEVTDAMM